MEKRRVVITGLGIISPLGNNIATMWDALLKGKSGVSKITAFDASKFDSQIAGEVKDFDPLKYFTLKESKRMERFVQFGVAATKQAVEDSGINISKEDPYRVGVLVGSGVGSLHMMQEQCRNYESKGPSRISPFMIPMLIVNEAAGNISIVFGAKGPNSCVATACATGNHAIGDAFRIIQHGYADAMIAGGTESCITPMGIGGFCSLKALSCRNNEPEKASRPFDKDRDGFIMAEGAGIVILEELEHAKKRGAKIYAEIVGYGMTGDAYHITAPNPSGESSAKAMEFAMKDANLKPEDIQYINAHGTSTQLNDKIETKAIKMSFNAHARKVAISSTKSMTGHLIGAAGGVEFVFSVLAIRDNIVPPTINLEHPDPECDLDYVPNIARQMKVTAVMSNSLGFGGHNASLVIQKFKG
ncbi:MAG: beta-ketoacyl-ACP synthase II [Candidatus Omnitrophica bacterium]|nr:beta-ketoacyl-ACP synthase II [Candidatus Omnitrophota bacterium]MDD5352702.1 beta-ketoacyl-ACP synthase II [Candidatus Omnitrophota bacterium]MDD5550301.1 beta-ketoacyl-ACP synthase II [Candidatus Omnitrophota bacterium]